MFNRDDNTTPTLGGKQGPEVNKAYVNVEAVEFLLKLRPPPWILVAITPDGPATAAAVRNIAEADIWLNVHKGQRNLYYQLNPAKIMNKKPGKDDIIAVEYQHADLDPRDNESPEEAKARYLEQINAGVVPKPTFLIDSGNGVQGLWKLTTPTSLGEEAGRAATIADAEARNKELMLRLGSKAGTQNIDRILRLPGTLNLPTKAKRERGRVQCHAKLLEFNDVSYLLDTFPPGTPEAFVPGTPDDGGHHARQQHFEECQAAIDVDSLPVSDRIKDLIRGINDPEYVYESRSEAVFAVVMAMLGAKCPDQQIQGIMFDKHLPIGAHVREQSRPVDYLVRQVRHALAKIGGPDAVIRDVKIKPQMENVLKSAAELRTKTFEPLRWTVPEYLPEGLTLLGGRPKIGKSWQALDIAVGVSSGGLCLGEKCEQGDVLALMLEDSDRRLQRRLTAMLGAQKEEWPARLTYATSWPRLNEGGLDWISKWISSSPRARLIIVDILERVRQLINAKDKRTTYSSDYEALIRLQELATEAMISILVLHHQRKLGADDLIDTLSGTLGLGGAVDSVLILGKELKTDNKFLWGRGRDLEEFSITVHQNEKMRWEVIGPRMDEQPSVERTNIIVTLSKSKKPMSIADITLACHSNHNNVKVLLGKLKAEGYIETVRRGLYKLVDPQNEIPF
ncbi:AAA domain-containing protein [Rhizobiales bacterium GAS191]|nr:AAA domain-containing protein [Rhizobiales bacterium GAS191]